MRRIAVFVLLASALVASGCAGDDDEPDASEAVAMTTPEPIRAAVWERSYSECSSYDVARLAGKYRVPRDRQQVAVAVGKDWADFFGGGSDAARVGRDGCLRGLDEQ